MTEPKIYGGHAHRLRQLTRRWTRQHERLFQFAGEMSKWAQHCFSLPPNTGVLEGRGNEPNGTACPVVDPLLLHAVASNADA